MEYVRLGRTGLLVSATSFGGWPAGGLHQSLGMDIGWYRVDPNQIARAVRIGMDSGVNLFDTCSAYGNSEWVLAHALRHTPKHHYHLASKVGYVRGAFDNAYEPKNIVAQVEGTLNAFDKDYVDILGFHNLYFGADGEYFDDAMETFHRLRDAGKIRWIAARLNHAPTFLHTSSTYERFTEDELDVILRIDPDVLQFKFNATMEVDAPWVVKLRSHIELHDLGVLVNKPLSQGLLLRKRYSGSFPIGDHRRRKPEFSKKNRHYLSKMLNRHLVGWDTTALVRAYLSHARSISDRASVLVGTRTPAQALINFSVETDGLSISEKELLEAVRKCFDRFEEHLALEELV